MERLHAVDALRALALLGILSVNIWYFAFPENLTGGGEGGGRSAGLSEGAAAEGAGALAGADQWVAFAATAIFEGKSYVIFSFLFGLAFVLQWGAAHRAGVSEVTRSQRRFTGLVVLGILHGIFLFVGDILLAYAVLGFALLGMRRIRTRTALLLAAALWAVVALAILGLGALTWVMESSGMMDPAMMDSEAAASSGLVLPTEEARAAYTGSLGSYLSFQLSAYALVAPSMLLVQGPMAFAAFLLGLVLGRAQMLERILAGEIPTTRLVAIMLPALAVGGALSVTAAWMVWGAEAGGLGAETLSAGLIFLAGPVQATGYVLAALLILRHRRFGWLVHVLAPAGRMSLSNYLGQSLVLALLFSALGVPLGLGVAGQLSASQVGVVVVLLWLAQLGISHLWLRFFARGPVEAPLRAWTYAAKPFPVKPAAQDHPSA